MYVLGTAGVGRSTYLRYLHDMVPSVAVPKVPRLKLTLHQVARIFALRTCLPVAIRLTHFSTYYTKHHSYIVCPTSLFFSFFQIYTSTRHLSRYPLSLPLSFPLQLSFPSRNCRLLPPRIPYVDSLNLASVHLIPSRWHYSRPSSEQLTVISLISTLLKPERTLLIGITNRLARAQPIASGCREST